MKFIVLNILIFMSLITHAQTSDKTVNVFFEALNQKNIAVIDSLTLDDLKLHSLQLQPKSNVSFSTKKEFQEGLKAIPKNINIEERIFDIESTVTEYLAQYTIPYEFYVNGELSHSGINVLTLIKIDNRWLISYIADTRKKAKTN
ncbi:nuclear transport factor 2 family protein [Flavobacteriaceae bacterium 14752]|uniref:nuclear transport factor 2 family protein n=1 Tax=Mesohalobacter salilacus TaxID=2491711 RepID=UPI000F63142F|nr:nuclear transport factor 2 family protein [Flavobacteriaceae bacterium 14752]